MKMLDIPAFKEAASHLKREIKDADLQARALKLLEDAHSYIELDEKKQDNDKRRKEIAKVKEDRAKKEEKKPAKEAKNDDRKI